jgi:hypothetical protein
MRPIFESEFQGMPLTEIRLEDLEIARSKLIKQINESLTEEERRFILSFKRMEPEWNLLQLDEVENLPAVKWKQLNLGRMEKKKHRKAVETLRQQLQI